MGSWWTKTSQNDGNRRINRTFQSSKLNRFRDESSGFGKKPKLGMRSYTSSKLLYRRINMQNAFHQGKMGAQLNWLGPLSSVVVNPWWRRLAIVQVIIILSSDLVLINVLSVTLEIRSRMLLKRMFKSSNNHVLANPCQPVISSESKFPSRINMGVLKLASLKKSQMKIFCLEVLSFSGHNKNW